MTTKTKPNESDARARAMAWVEEHAEQCGPRYQRMLGELLQTCATSLNDLKLKALPLVEKFYAELPEDAPKMDALGKELEAEVVGLICFGATFMAVLHNVPADAVAGLTHSAHALAHYIDIESGPEGATQPGAQA